MEATPWRTGRRRSLSGSLKVWHSGRATFIPGSTRLEQLSLDALPAPWKPEFCLSIICWLWLKSHNLALCVLHQS